MLIRLRRSRGRRLTRNNAEMHVWTRGGFQAVSFKPQGMHYEVPPGPFGFFRGVRRDVEVSTNYMALVLPSAIGADQNIGTQFIETHGDRVVAELTKGYGRLTEDGKPTTFIVLLFNKYGETRAWGFDFENEARAALMTAVFGWTNNVTVRRADGHVVSYEPQDFAELQPFLSSGSTAHPAAVGMDPQLWCDLRAYRGGAPSEIWQPDVHLTTDAQFRTDDQQRMRRWWDTHWGGPLC